MKNKENEMSVVLIPVINIRTSVGLINLAGTCIYCGTFVSESEDNMVVIYGPTVMCEHCEIEQGF